MAGHILVQGVAEGAGDQDAEIQQRNEPRQLFCHPEGGGGLGIDPSLFHKQKCFKVLRGESKGSQELLRGT